MNDTPPKWATDLVERACADRPGQRPIIVWRPRNAVPAGWENVRKRRLIAGEWLDTRTDMSGGYRMGDLLVVYHGRNRQDQKLVLLHELAHWMTNESHTPRFWDQAWALYRTYMPRSIQHAIDSETNYKKGALHAAVRAGILPREAKQTTQAEGRDDGVHVHEAP